MNNWSDEVRQGTRVETDHSQEGETRFRIVLSDDENVRELIVIVTPEGIFMDVYDKAQEENKGVVPDDIHSGTTGMMFDEWAEWVVGGGIVPDWA